MQWQKIYQVAKNFQNHNMGGDLLHSQTNLKRKAAGIVEKLLRVSHQVENRIFMLYPAYKLYYNGIYFNWLNKNVVCEEQDHMTKKKLLHVKVWGRFIKTFHSVSTKYHSAVFSLWEQMRQNESR